MTTKNKRGIGKEEMRILASQCKTLNEFRKKHPGAYERARTGGFVRDLGLSPITTRIWTEKTIRSEAVKYETITEFAREKPAAWANAKKLGILDELFSRKIRKLSDDEIISIISKYKTRGDLINNDASLYNMARRRNLLDFVGCERTQWTPEKIIAEAAGCAKRSHFGKKNGSAYNAARKLGLIDELFTEKRISRGVVKWNPDSVRAEAAKYSRKQDFMLGSPGAHVAAIRYKMLDDLFPDNDASFGLRDSVYIWKAQSGIYKVGITSSNIGTKRIKDVARCAGVTAEIIIMANLGSASIANDVENKLLSIGRKYSFPNKFNGSEEFRTFTDEELDQAVSVINEAANETGRSNPIIWNATKTCRGSINKRSGHINVEKSRQHSTFAAIAA